MMRQLVYLILFCVFINSGLAVPSPQGDSEQPEQQPATAKVTDATAPETTVRVFNLPVGQVDTAINAVHDLFPDGADHVNIAEVGPNGLAVTAHVDGLPSDEQIKKLLTDDRVGQHFPEETVLAVGDETPPEGMPLPDAIKPRRHNVFNPLNWTKRFKFFVARVVANGAIAGALVALKNEVHGEATDWARIGANVVVHGGVNGFFQWFGARVGEFAYANPASTRRFPDFTMSLPHLLLRTIGLAFPKRVALTIGSVMIYRLTDFAFTGNFSFGMDTFYGICANIAAALAPSMWGFEMGGRLGPKWAKDLEPRSKDNVAFDLQNFVISVLFAAGLAANSPEMNTAFGVHGVWTPIYTGVAIGGALLWAVNTRYINPTLKPVTAMVVDSAKWCGRQIGRIGSLLRWKRNSDPDPGQDASAAPK